jgi:hypothetical protein
MYSNMVCRCVLLNIQTNKQTNKNKNTNKKWATQHPFLSDFLPLYFIINIQIFSISIFDS